MNKNRHRNFKRSFQANLDNEENEIVKIVKENLDVKTDRQLLMMLCRHEYYRIKKEV